MRKTSKRYKPQPLARPVLQAHPKYADQKFDHPVVLVKPRNPEHWKKDPRVKEIGAVENDIDRLQREYVRSHLIDRANELPGFHLTVGRQRLI